MSYCVKISFRVVNLISSGERLSVKEAFWIWNTYNYARICGKTRLRGIAEET